MTKEKLSSFAYRAASFLLVLCTGFLVWRPNNYSAFGEAIPTWKPSDLILLPLFVSLSLGFIWDKEKFNESRLRFFGKCFLVLTAFLTSTLFGSAWAHLFLHQNFSKLELVEYSRLIIDFGIFLAIIFLSYKNNFLPRLILYSFITSLVLAPALFLSEKILLKWFWVSSPINHTFLGTQPGTPILGNLLIIPILVLFSLFLNQNEPLKKTAAWIFAITLIALSIWTATRASWLGLTFGTVILLWQHWRVLGTEFKKHLIFILAAFLIAPLLLSNEARNTSIVHLFPRPNAISGVSELMTVINLPTIDFIQKVDWSTGQSFWSSRGQIWSDYLAHVYRAPFGLGPTYFESAPVKNSSNLFVSAHSIFLQVLLSAGVLGLILFIVLGFNLFSKLIKLPFDRSKIFEHYALPSIFGGIFVNLLFIDGLSFRWLWVILALATVFIENNSKLTSSQS